MFTGRRKPNNSEPEEEGLRNAEIRKRLINELSIAIKELQKAHIESNFEVDRNDEQAQLICTLLEVIFLHGYQGHGSKFSNFYNLLGKISTVGSIPTHSFWEFLVIFTHKDIVNELQHLTHISTDVGRSRAWIRLALNDGLMESYLDAMLSDQAKLHQYYKSSSFLMDGELPFIMISFLQGLVEYTFDFNYNTTSLNTWTGDTLTLAGIWQMPRVARPSLTGSGVHVLSSPSTIPVSIPAQIDRRHVEARGGAHAQLAVSVASEPEVGEFVRSLEESAEFRAVGRQRIRGSPVEIKPVAVSRPVVMQTPGEHVTKPSETLPSPQRTPTEVSPNSHSGDDQQPKGVDSDDTTPVTSPIPLTGSNKLGVTCGWSSSFDAEAHDTVDHGTRDHETRDHETRDNETHDNETRDHVGDTSSPVADVPGVYPVSPVSPVRKPPSFRTLLSDYTVQAPGGFDSPSYGGSLGGRKRPTAPRQIAQARKPTTPVDGAAGFEVVPQSSSVHSEHADEGVQQLMAILTEISNEKGLDSQNYQCRNCGRNIGMIYGEAKVCVYDACYYCYECHVDEEHVIPARVLHNWDFRKHRVARQTKLFLLQIEEDPLFNVDETNPTLYNVIAELNEVKMLRSQLQHLKGFLFTCKQPIAGEIRRRIWPREYLWDDIHQYSLLDLVQVQSGQLAHHLKKIISHCTKHVYRCKLCCQKGFICEMCNNPKIIYPFEIKTTSQCPNCRAVYHKPCIFDSKCPKCIRKRRLHASIELNAKSGLEFDAPW